MIYKAALQSGFFFAHPAGKKVLILNNKQR
jgi:hypothetical protein